MKEKECCEKCGMTRENVRNVCTNSNCPCHTKETEWEEEFGEKFGTIKHRGFPQQAIKSFIKQVLQDYKAELLGKIEGLKTKGENLNQESYNYALEDVKSVIGAEN